MNLQWKRVCRPPLRDRSVARVPSLSPMAVPCLGNLGRPAVLGIERKVLELVQLGAFSPFCFIEQEVEHTA